MQMHETGCDRDRGGVCMMKSVPSAEAVGILTVFDRTFCTET